MKVVVFLVVVLVVLVLARNVVVKAAVENGVKIVTGMPLSIQKFDLDIVHTSMDIENLLLKNPPGFHDTALLDIPKVLVAYERASIFTGKVHLKTIEFDMKQFTVVKNERGELNLDRLRSLQGTQKPSQPTRQEPKAPAKAIPIQIDLMRLKIGKVVYTDYSGVQPVTKEFSINLDQSFQNITDLRSVMRLIVMKAMMSSGISNLVNFDIGGLENTLTGAFNTSAKFATQEASKGVAAAEKTVTSGVKSAASSLKSKLKIPF
jgi:hypothetical protein